MFNLWKIDYAAVHDGPGIRTSLYLKGCPLRCLWCSNPEGQTETPNLVFKQARCIDCRLCEEVCPAKAIVLGHFRDRQLVAKLDALKGVGAR